MYLFLIPLLAGFTLDCASAFTAAYSQRWGERGGQLVTFLLRVILAFPSWFTGLFLAMQATSTGLLPSNPVTEALGWMLVGAGCVPMILGLLALRRPAALPSTHDVAVVHGIYAHIRHPIYSGMLLEFLGLALLRPAVPVWLACALGLGWMLVKTWLEERDLVRRVPGYRAYMQRVPRFVPRLWKSQPD